MPGHTLLKIVYDGLGRSPTMMETGQTNRRLRARPALPCASAVLPQSVMKPLADLKGELEKTREIKSEPYSKNRRARKGRPEGQNLKQRRSTGCELTKWRFTGSLGQREERTALATLEKSRRGGAGSFFRRLPCA